MASSLALALRSGRSTLAVAGVFGACKTRSLTFLLAWLALTTHLKIAVVHKENPAGRAITKLLTAISFGQLGEKKQKLTPYIPGCHVVIVTTGLVWDQKGQTHSTLNTHMENVDLLISEEAQQDMDLKSAFAPTVPRQPFFRLLLGDPKQSPGGVYDREPIARSYSKLPLGYEPPLPGTCHMKYQGSFTCSSGTVEALALVT